MIKGWNYAGRKVRVNKPSFPSPTWGLISGLVPYCRLPYLPKFSTWSFSFIPCRYLPASIIPTLYHNRHELNSEIILTIYFCTHFLRQEILHQHFLRLKNLHVYFGYVSVCGFFAIKNKCTNICDTNNCNAKNFDAKNDVAKIKIAKILVDLFLYQLLCQKFLRKKFFCYNFLSIYFCNGVFCSIYFCMFN